MPGAWHIEMQNIFEKTQQEVEFLFVHGTQDGIVTKRRRIADVCVDATVIECQHSRITREEVNDRNEDYGTSGKTVAWVIDCTENVSRPHKISSEEDDEEVWMLELERAWHSESMHDCENLFAVFADEEYGRRIFRVPMNSVRHRLVLVFGSWVDMEKWKTYVTSGQLDEEIKVPIQSTLMVFQDPHGSGKTYSLSRLIIYTNEDARYAGYSTFIVVTKAKSALAVVYVEFMLHLQAAVDAGLLVFDRTRWENDKHIVNFTRQNGSEILCIFGTVDSLVYNLTENKMRGTDFFMNLVKTIHKHGPSKLQGPKGRFRYAGEQPHLNKKSLIITDEATILPESYADAFATLMSKCHVDFHLAGDVQQSTFYENNLLTRVVREYNEATDGSSLPSFPGCTVIIKPGNEVRRFNQALVDFRNTVMGGFHDSPSHNLHIKLPVAAQDVVHARGEFSFHTIERTTAWDDADAEQVVSTVEVIMDQLKRDINESKLLPNDILVITPFVKNNPLMDELQTSIHQLWGKLFYDAEYERLVNEKAPNETDESFANRKASYAETLAHFENPASSSLPWFCVLHRSEENRPLTMADSKHGTRIVSIHASQGDGRKFAYVVGLAEKKLTRFSSGKINLKYESLLNVSISRMKEVIRIFLEPTYDDIWERFLPLMDDALRHCVPPVLNAKTKFALDGACNIDLDQTLFNLTKEKIVAATSLSDASDGNRPVVDYAHHVIRMAVAHTVFWAHLTVNQAIDSEDKEQVLTIFRWVAKARVREMPSKDYYKELRNDDKTKYPLIPILEYDTGAASYTKVLQRSLEVMREVQVYVRSWVRGEMTELKDISPEHAILLQYAVEVYKSAPYGKENIKMDHVYDVVHCYMNKTDEITSDLQLHYCYLSQLTETFNRIKDYIGEEVGQWKIYRSITLGNKRTGIATQNFQFTKQIADLFVTEKRAMPILMCSVVDETNMAPVCAQALLSTLICLQPEQKEHKGADKGIPTWKYLQDRKIEVCIIPVRGTRPIFIDLTEIVENNIAVIADWICAHAKNETEAGTAQALKIADHYGHDFPQAQDQIQSAFSAGKCPEYIREAFNEASDKEEVSDLLKAKLEVHMRSLSRDIRRR